MIQPRSPGPLIDHMKTAVLSFDDQLCLTYINAAGEMLLENSARLILGQPLNTLFYNAPRLIETLSEALHSGLAFSEREIPVILANMHTATVNYMVTPIEEPGQTTALIVELIQVDRQLRIAREESLLAQNQTVRALMRGMAHEIKNPLGGLRGAAQLLERELPDDTLKEYTQVIIDEADRLQNLLNSMLGPNTPPKKRMINIHSALEHVRTLVQAEAHDGITIERDYDPSIPDLYGDSEQLIQAILNIMRNAVQAVGDNGHIILRTRTQRQVTIGHQRHRLALRLDIINNGPGIPDTMLEEIFYPMVTGRAEGTGLGLPIAQSLINQHDGLIECSSRPQETVFTLFLPLEPHHE